MNIADLLKNIFETGKEDFNEGALDKFVDVLSENVQYYTPEVKTKNFYTPEKLLKNKKEVLEYWSWLHAKYQVEMTNFEYLEIGKISRIRCEYAKQHYALDLEMHFNEYGKVLRIIHSHVEDKRTFI